MPVMFTARPISAQRRTRLAVAVVIVFTIWHTFGAMFGVHAASHDHDRVADRIVVGFNRDAPGHARAAARQQHRGEQVLAIPALDVEVWQMRPDQARRALDGLRRNPHVAHAELDAVVELDEVATVEPNDPDHHRQWGQRQVNAPAAWAISTSTAAVTVAILDTGVDAVPDLAGKLLPGRNVLTGTSDVTDGHGHGTASAGVAAAATDNRLLVAGYGWNASVLPVKVMDGSSGTMSTLAAGIVWATDNGADVISMSLSGSTGTTAVRDAVRYAHGRGVLLVAAAGNRGDTVERYPAAYTEVIGVAGTDSNDALYSWSNHGSWVDVAAPGSNRSLLRDGGAFNYAGTSSATPAVAGVLSLGVPYASGSDLRAALLASAAALPFVKHGRIDAHAMLDVLGAGAPSPAKPDPVGPSAAFTATCDLLSCLFVDQSKAGDAPITSWSWVLGDGTIASGARVDHTHAAAGSYPVSLTVTDGNGLTSSAQQVVTVTAPEPESATSPEPEPAADPIHLRASGSKTKGTLSADLVWSGTSAARVDLYVGGAKVATLTNTGSTTHRPSAKGNPSITYQICDAGSTVTCSAVVTVSSW